MQILNRVFWHDITFPILTVHTSYRVGFPAAIFAMQILIQEFLVLWWIRRNVGRIIYPGYSSTFSKQRLLIHEIGVVFSLLLVICILIKATLFFDFLSEIQNPFTA